MCWRLPGWRTREARIDELTGAVVERTEASAVWQERARVLTDQLALMAPQQPVDAPTATEPSPPWWNRWWWPW